MPGLAGFVNSNKEYARSKSTLKKMLDLISPQQFNILDPVFCKKEIVGGRSHNNVIQKNEQPFSSDEIHVWMAGEFYNQKELKQRYHINENEDIHLLHGLYKSDSEFEFLKHVDGGFTAVIYDENRERIHLLTDRYGRQHLYWTKYKERFVWSSELKAFSVLPNFDLSIDRRSLEDFISMGSILGEKTWFKKVYLLPAASILSLNVKSNQYKIKRYWWWDEVESFTYKDSINELAMQTGDLLKEAVESRCKTDIDSIGIALSGGRDSRAVLASIPESEKTLYAITFGQKNSRDVKIAARAAKLKEARHHIHYLSADNWLEERFISIWWTDGQTSLIHLNSVVGFNSHREFYNVCFTGLGGEVLAGKNRMFQIENVDKYISEKYNQSNISEEFRTRLKSDIESDGSAEVFYLNHRFRKFSALGLKRGESSGIQSRVPFLDNKLMEFLHGLPYEYKAKARLYDRILILKFPIFFKDIKWEGDKNVTALLHNLGYYSLKSVNKIKTKASKAGLCANIKSQFTDYDRWIRLEPARSMFESIIYNKNAIYPEFVDPKVLNKYYKEHLNGIDHHKILCRYLTFEIWLQQLFNQAYLEH